MRNSRNLLILMLILAILTGSYIYLNTRPKKDDVTEPEKVELSSFDAGKLVKMTLASSENTLVFEKKDDVWAITSPEGLRGDSNAISTVAESFAALYADRIVDESPDGLIDYGLDSPSVTAAAVLADGSQKVFHVGNKTPDGSSYYMMTDDDPKVYMVSSYYGGRFSYKLSNFIDKKLFTVDTGSFRSVIITRRSEQTTELIRSKEQVFGIHPWVVVKPYRGVYPANDQKVTELIGAIAALNIYELIELDTQDLSKYGLDNPFMGVTLVGEKDTISIYFGNDRDESQIYFRVGDSNTIYTALKTDLEKSQIPAFGLIEKFVDLQNIDDVDKVEIEGRGEKYVLTLTRTEKPAKEEGKEPEIITTYKINGKEVKEEDDFKNLYQSIISLTYEAENDRQVQQSPEVRVTFFLNKGSSKNSEAIYSPYNSDFYAVFKNGSADFLISRDQVNQMLDALESMAGK